MQSRMGESLRALQSEPRELSLNVSEKLINSGGEEMVFMTKYFLYLFVF